MYNEQRQIAYINMEYCYLQYCCGLSKSLSASGTHSSFLYDNFRDCGDPVQFAGKELWPKFLSQVIMVLQKPMYDMQKRSFVYHEALRINAQLKKKLRMMSRWEMVLPWLQHLMDLPMQVPMWLRSGLLPPFNNSLQCKGRLWQSGPSEDSSDEQVSSSSRRGSLADYWGMAVEFNNRLLQAFTAGKPLDAYPKSSRQLRQYGDAYVKQTRERDSLMMLGFTEALTPLSPPAPLIFNPMLWLLNIKHPLLLHLYSCRQLMCLHSPHHTQLL
ncbi:hypothetical protein WJX77_010317 [Trebouxia sp. C0004]